MRRRFLFYAAAHLFIGLGTATGFGPLIADITHWFERRRGIAVGISSSGNYLAGACGRLSLQPFVASEGWRATHHRGRHFLPGDTFPVVPAAGARGASSSTEAQTRRAQPAHSAFRRSRCRYLASRLPALPVASRCRCRRFTSSPIAAISVTASHAAQTCPRLWRDSGIVSRIGSGFIADRVGGLRTLLLGSFMQAVALKVYACSTVDIALRHLRAVRIIPGRHRAELRHHRA